MQVFTRIDTFISWTQATVGTSAAAIFDKTNTDRAQQSVFLTNNHASNTVYVGPDNTVTSSKFVWAIAAGATIAVNLGQGAAEQLYAIASGASTPLGIAVGQ